MSRAAVRSGARKRPHVGRKPAENSFGCRNLLLQKWQYVVRAPKIGEGRGEFLFSGHGALSDQIAPNLAGLLGGIDAPIQAKAREPIPLLQLVARTDPPSGNDVCADPAVALQRRGSAV